MDNCFCIYNGETDKFDAIFFQLPPIVNWKVTLIIFQKKRHFFVIFFSFSICGRSQKILFFNFFRKTWKNFKVIFKKIMYFWHHMWRILTFFCTQNEVESSYRNAPRKFGFFLFFWKIVFTIDGGHFFLCFWKQKIQIEHPYEGGGSKSPFLKTRLSDY